MWNKQLSRSRVIGVNADADLDDDLDSRRNKNGTQCVPFLLAGWKLTVRRGAFDPVQSIQTGQ